MVVGYLAVVDNAAVYVKSCRKHIVSGFVHHTEHTHTFFKNSSHILGQIVAVCSGVGKQLLFVERLHNRKRCSRRKAKFVIRFDLQRGKRKKQRTIFFFLLCIDENHFTRRVFTLCLYTLCFGTGRKTLTLIVKPFCTVVELQLEIRLLGEMVYLVITFCNHIDNGGLNSPDGT